MRIRSRKNLKKKNTAIVFLFLLPIIGFLAFAAGALYILDDMSSFTFKIDPPNTDNFYPQEDINHTILAQMAQIVETRWEQYHSPTNISVDAIFTDNNYDNVSSYVPTDNGAQWTGMMLAAEVFRYVEAKQELNQTEIDHSIKLIRKMVTCFSNFLAAPNGGIGPEYNAICARFVAAPNETEIWPFMFADDPIHFNGTGIYSNWRVRLSTSLDEMAGYIMGLSSVLMYVAPGDSDTAKWCYERTRLLTAQLIEGFKRSNWLMISGEGNPCGTDLNAYFGGIWKLALLKMGAIAYPEKSYSQYYLYTAMKSMHLNKYTEGSSWGVIMDYYGLTNSVCVQIVLVLMEENPQLRFFYIKKYEEGIYFLAKYHRNSYINIAHLVFMSLLNENEKKQFYNPDYDDNKVLWDILDNLYRFHTSGWMPIRNYNLLQRPHSTRATSLDPSIRMMELAPAAQKWRDFFENNMLGKLYSWLDVEFEFEDHYMLPTSVSEMQSSSLIWEDNPFRIKGGNPTGNGLQENTGMSYSIVYWMGRAYDIF
jgi:hypothetical protein